MKLKGNSLNSNMQSVPFFSHFYLKLVSAIDLPYIYIYLGLPVIAMYKHHVGINFYTLPSKKQKRK